METPVTPRMIFGMNAGAIACTIAAFHRAAHYEPTEERYVYLSFADSAARILRNMIGTDDAYRLIQEQVALLQGCVAQLADPKALGEEVDAWIRTQAR